ncbi:MAG: PorV/PorQ family protein [Elusimicrobia bacterium]|nr:PorV/PorQ family protein [Elusimicrobiota bacterium]
MKTFVGSVFLLAIVASWRFGQALQIAPRQTIEDGGLAGSYLTNFGVNARALAMGKAYTAVADDASAPYWNPAGLAQMNCREATLLHAGIFAGTDFNYVGYAHPFNEKTALGASWVNIETADIEKTDYFGSPVGTFSDQENAYYISSALRLKQNLNIGLNLKIVTQSLDVYSTMGYGLDLSGLYRYNDFINCGFTLQNLLGPHLKLKEETDKFPLNLKTGVAVKLFSRHFLYALDFDFLNLMPTDSSHYSVKWHTGVEYRYPLKLVTLAIRAGRDYKETSSGIGLSTRFFDFNYAIGFHELETTHRFSITARFGLLPTAEEKELQQQRLTNLVSEHYQLALKYFNEQNYALALDEAQKVQALNEDYQEVKNIIGQIGLIKQRQEALNYFNQALLFYQNNDLKNAAERLKLAEGLNPDIKKEQEDAHLAKAKELVCLRQYTEAEAELTTVLIINSDNNEAREQLNKLREIMPLLK